MQNKSKEVKTEEKTQEEKMKEIRRKKLLIFFRPLISRAKILEAECAKSFENFDNSKVTFDFNHDFIMFTDIEASRHLSMLGIMKHFNTNLKYKFISLDIILDIWYNQTESYTKDSLRRADLLIFYRNY